MASHSPASPRFAAAFLSALAVGVVVVACGADPDPADPSRRGVGPDDGCGTPNEGCPCSAPGDSVECGQVKQQSGDYVACTMGTRTCLAGRWGACIGTHLVTKSVVAAGAIHTAAVTQGPCPPPPSPLANPCDPYCHQVIDDGSLTIPGAAGGGTCAWFESADKTAAYAALNGGWQAIRGGSAAAAGPCTTGTSDACGHDSWCPAGTGCQFFSSGGTNTACGAQWDLTFGTPCAGTTDTLTICNRGGAPTPAAGTYWGAVTNASLQGQPTDVSLCKTNPANVRGYCSIDFASVNIAPGTCVSAPTATICPGVNFGSSGVPGTDRTTIQWNMPDWPDPACGNRARVAGECIDKNNFTSFDQNKAIACVGLGCSGGAGSTATTGNAEVYPVPTTASGVTTCGGAVNVDNGGGACAPPGYATCRQDFRCDVSSNTCRWNGGSGYFDPGAGGIDLTVGTPCGAGGATPWSIPICNRGSVTAPAGNVTLHFTNPPTAPDTCGPVASPFPPCVVPLPIGGLEPGQCMATTACPSPGPGAKFVTVNWGGGVTEAPGACANNVAGAKDDGTPGCGTCNASCNTRISGRVFDPSSGLPAIANANNLPLSGISVFEPSGALTPLVDGLACDSCATTDSPKVLNRLAVTDAAGAFVLPNVVPGPATRVVVQSGRWRREVTVPVTPCIDNALAPGVLRLPRDRFDGNGGAANLPKTALFFGDNDKLQCLIRKLGVSASEMLPYTGPANANRFHIFRHPTPGDAGQVTVPAAPTDDVGIGLLSNYSQLIAGCTSGGVGLDVYSTAQIDQIITWAQAGGRAFLTHGPARTVVRDNPSALGLLARSTGTWDGDANGPRTAIVTGTPPNDTFRDWMFNVGGSATWGLGFTDADPKTPFPINPATKATAWLRGLPPSTGAFMYSFETPINAADCGTPQGLGRVFFSGQHTSNRAATGSNFSTPPNSNCNLTTPLLESEKALAFHYFNLAACRLGGAPPPPPPPPLAVSFATRDYEGVCPVGTFPEWQFLFWQSVTVPGTSVEFRVATAATQAALPPSPPAGAPVSVYAGTASGSTVAPPAWASDGNTVAWHLANDPPGPPQPSQRWVRVYAKMNPIGALAPTITALRLDYSCRPAE